MSISSAIKSASSRWLSWRSECRCGAWHPEIISPCGTSPRCSRSRQVSNATCAPMLCPASKSGVSGDTDASSSFASSAASCVMLLSGSRWRRRSRPYQVTRESAQSASCSACQWRNALLLPPAKGHMTRCAVLPFRAGHSGMHIADCVTAPPYHHRCRNRLTGRGAAASGV